MAFSKRFSMQVFYCLLTTTTICILLFAYYSFSAHSSAIEHAQATNDDKLDGSHQKQHAASPGRSDSTRSLEIAAVDLTTLENRAASGDSAAATELADDSNHCFAMQMTLGVIDTYLDQDISAMSEDQKKKYDSSLQKLDERIKRYFDFCRQYGKHLVANRLKNLLNASQLGDIHAGYCFAGSTIDLTGQNVQPDELKQYQAYAREFLEAGVQRGDWTAARQLFSAFNAPGYFRQDYKATLVIPDPVSAYRYAKLLQMGGAENVEGPPITEALIANLSAALTPADMQSADAWVNQIFIQKFSSHPYEGGLSCM